MVRVISPSSLSLNQGFIYDGMGPATHFWADTSKQPTDDGMRLLDASPSGSCGMTPLPAANGTASYRVEFPAGKTINDYLNGCKFNDCVARCNAWWTKAYCDSACFLPLAFAVWCEVAAANFGEVHIPATLDGLGVVTTAEGPALECSAEAVPVSSPVLLGNLTTRAHEVAGVVYLLSESVIEIEVRESI
jgi:Electron transfer DM13